MEERKKRPRIKYKTRKTKRKLRKIGIWRKGRGRERRIN